MNKVTHQDNAQVAGTGSGVPAQGIMVLGMHRSGTSACVRVLNLLGCALSDRLLGAGEGNEAGHWEPVETVTLNDEMLISAGSSHDDWGPINPDWGDSVIRSRMVQRAGDVLADHAMLGPLFAIKDPRMCRLADVWLEAAGHAGVEPLVLLLLRNPVEVAASLEVRDLMSKGYGELLWLRHVLDAEFFSRGQKRVICSYDELMNNWQILVEKIKTGLGVVFPRNSPKTRIEISQFLSHAHRHHVADPAMVTENPAHSEWLRKTFQVMLNWSEGGEAPSDYRVLDDVRAEMDRAYATFAPLLLTPVVAGVVGSGGQLRAELALLRDETERKTEALRQTSGEAEEIRAAAEQRETELAARVDVEVARVKSLQFDIERLSADLASHSTSDEDAAALRAALTERTAELEFVQSALNESLVEAETERQRRAEAEERLAEASRALQEQQLLNAELAGRIAALQSTLIQRQEELAQLLSQFHAAEQVRVRAEMELEQERERSAKLVERVRAESAAETARMSREIEQLAEAVRTAEVAHAETESKLGARFDELAQLTTFIASEADRADAAESQAKWMSAVRRLEDGFPAWWAIMPRAWRQRRAHRRLHRAGLFDAEAYLAIHPDVAAAAMDPLRHYMLHGIAEGRTRPQPP